MKKPGLQGTGRLAPPGQYRPIGHGVPGGLGIAVPLGQ